MKISYLNQEDLPVEIEILGPGKWLVSINVDETASTEFLVGTSLNQYNSGLPNHIIKAVRQEPYAVDPSGYEYFGWIIYTALWKLYTPRNKRP